jgi:hypothetical protein
VEACLGRSRKGICTEGNIYINISILYGIINSMEEQEEQEE